MVTAKFRWQLQLEITKKEAGNDRNRKWNKEMSLALVRMEKSCYQLNIMNFRR